MPVPFVAEVGRLCFRFNLKGLGGVLTSAVFQADAGGSCEVFSLSRVGVVATSCIATGVISAATADRFASGILMLFRRVRAALCITLGVGCMYVVGGAGVDGSGGWISGCISSM